MTNKTVTMSRELAEDLLNPCADFATHDRLRAILDAPVVEAATCAQCKSSTADICNQNGCGYLESGNGAPVVERQDPVAVLYADGSVLTKAECGTAFDTCCKVETPLYTSPPAPVAVVPIAVQEVDEEFEKWWESDGQYCRAGGGSYEKTFAYRAYEAAIARANNHYAFLDKVKEMNQ